MTHESVYLDHAATTPLRESAREAWLRAVTELSGSPGNPSALHSGGRGARLMLEDARERLATALGADRAEVIFTSGATESAAIGVMGVARAAALIARDGVSSGAGAGAGAGADPAIAVSAVEHPAVAQQRVVAEREGIDWHIIPVKREGTTDLSALAGAVGQPDRPGQLVLVSMCWVCSETGVIQPVEQLVELGDSANFLVHTDATQAVGNIPIDFASSGLDSLTLGGHKFGGPVGAGALLVKRGVRIGTDRPGGNQERQFRSGTPDVAGAVALATAAEEASVEIAERQRKHSALRQRLLWALPEAVTATEVAQTVSSIVHLSLPTRHPEALLLELDRANVMASAGSACHAGVTRPSEVILAMGRTEDEALGVLRVSFGRETTEADIDRFVAVLPRALESARNMDRFDRRQ